MERLASAFGHNSAMSRQAVLQEKFRVRLVLARPFGRQWLRLQIDFTSARLWYIVKYDSKVAVGGYF